MIAMSTRSTSQMALSAALGECSSMRSWADQTPRVRGLVVAEVIMRRLTDSHARVGQRVHEVDEDVEQHDRNADDEHGGLDEREVAVEHRADHEGSDAGKGEHGADD